MPPRAALSTASRLAPKPSVYTHCKSCLHRSFSSTATSGAPEGAPGLADDEKRAPGPSPLRKAFFAWLEGPGEAFRYPLPGSTNYLTAYDKSGNLIRALKEGAAEGAAAETADAKALDEAATGRPVPKEDQDDLRPFPMNRHFISQSILSEDLRLQIWKRVQVDGKSVRQTSAELGVDMRRVAAVVRLVDIERRMKAEGKQLAIPYARAIHTMVPLTHLDPNTNRPTSAHESINDLEQHPLTFPQLFYPTSESRAFNRTDAGRVFSGAPRLPDEHDIGQGGKNTIEPWQDTKPEIIGKRGRERPVLKPADSRIPHPHLIAYAKDKVEYSREERQQRYHTRLQEDADARKALKAKREAAEEGKKTRIDTGRWQFVVTDVQTTRQGTGVHGRGTGSPGYRYGVPSQDRKKGQVKIPTKVEV